MFTRGVMAVVLVTLLVVTITQGTETQKQEEKQQQHQDKTGRQQKEVVQEQIKEVQEQQMEKQKEVVQEQEKEQEKEQQQETTKEVKQKDDMNEKSRFLFTGPTNSDVSVTIGSSTLVVFFVAVVSFVVALSALLDVVMVGRVKVIPIEAGYGEPSTYALPVPVRGDTSYDVHKSLEDAQKRFE